MADTVRVLLVDDHQVVRQGLRTFLSLQPAIQVVGEAADGREALEQARVLQPDVVLMDLVMPVMDGVEATRRLRAELPNCRVVALTSFAEEQQVVPAVRAGASGYLLKDVRPEELVQAIVAASRGEHVLHPRAREALRQGLAAGGRQPALPREPLTPREQEVLERMVAGRSNKEIGVDLAIGEKTVKTHVSNILAKLEAADRTQAVVAAIKLGLVTLE